MNVDTQNTSLCTMVCSLDDASSVTISSAVSGIIFMNRFRNVTLLVCIRAHSPKRHTYSTIKTTKSLSFCTTTFSARLEVLLPKNMMAAATLSRRILASPPLGMHEHTDLRAYYSRTVPTCDNSLGSLTLPAPEGGDFVELLLLCAVPSKPL
jgi:hypothetical protein